VLRAIERRARPGRRRDEVRDQDAVLVEPVACQPYDLRRGQLERDLVLLVRVEDDQVVGPVRLPEELPTILDVDAQPG
jgi:hypothetical protein